MGMGKWLQREEVENKFSWGYIFKISPRWRHLVQVGNTALMLKEETGVGDTDLVIITIEITVRATGWMQL